MDKTTAQLDNDERYILEQKLARVGYVMCRVTILEGGYWKGETGGRFYGFTRTGKARVEKLDGSHKTRAYNPENVRLKAEHFTAEG